MAVSVTACGGGGSGEGLGALVKEEEDFGLTPSDFDKTQNIEQTVLYDQNNVVITANALNYGVYEVEIDLTFENKSNKAPGFVAESLGYSVNAVNGFMVEDGYLNLDVPAGGTENGKIGFSYSELLLLGISKIADVQVGFQISDDDYNYSYTGPLRAKTALADKYDYDNKNYRKAIRSKSVKYTYNAEITHFAEDVVYDSNGVSVVSEVLMVNKDGDRNLMLEVKNATDRTVYFQTSEFKANGIAIYDSTWSYDCITAGNRMIVSIRLEGLLDKEEWAEKGITELESIGMKIDVFDSASFDAFAVAEPMEITIDLK